MWHCRRVSDYNSRFMENLSYRNNITYYRGRRAGQKVHRREINQKQSISVLVTDRLSSKFAYTVNRSVNINNLITVDRNPEDQHPDKGKLLFCCVNPRSVRNKTDDFVEYIIDSQIDICAVTETWLTVNDDVVRSALKPNGYSFLDQHRLSERRGGGTGILFKDTFIVDSICSGEKSSFEFSEWKLTSSSNFPLRLCVVYRPPYSGNHPVCTGTFFREFSEYLDTIIMSSEPLVITGDFNIHMDVKDDPDRLKMFDLLQSYGLNQHVHVPTHESGHILDLIISRNSCDIIIDEPQSDYYISDHFSVLCHLAPPKPGFRKETVSYRKVKSINLDSFKKDLKDGLSECSSNTLNDLLSTYSRVMSVTLDSHAPVITKTILTRPKQPWFNDDIKASKLMKKKAERVWRKNKTDETRDVYKQKRNDFKDAIREAKREYFSGLINSCDKNQKKLFQIVKTLTRKSTENPLPKHNSLHELANDFGTFFVEKVRNIREKLDEIQINDSTLEYSSPVTKLENFKPLKESEVGKLINKMSNATSAFDPAPTLLVKDSLECLLPIITKIVDTSLQTGVFPNDWKTALVKPLLKKPKLSRTLSNYRPVSNLSFLSKLTEKAATVQITKHMSANCPLPDLQSSYRPNHSTETALLKVYSDILLSMDRQEVTLLIMLDLSAAFDTIDHAVLLQTLQNKFGLEGNVLRWIRSYLTDRKQQIQLGNTKSNEFDLPFGVPQGSCLGPILFIMYASSMFEVVKRHLPNVHGYADDTKLYLSFRPDTLLAQDRAIQAMHACISDVRKWMLANKLKINDDKSEFIIFGSKQQLSKINISSINIGEESIEPTESVRDLGVIIDANLSMDNHVSKVCNTAFRQLYIIKQIRPYLTEDATKILVHALITAHIDYCNSLLYGISNYRIDKLQKLLNAAARLVLLIPKHEHITPSLISLHWLPVKFRIIYKIILLVFKGTHNLAPKYISDMLTSSKVTRYSLRSADSNTLNVPRTKCKTFGDRAFAVCGPRLWNQLPSHLRKINNIDSFKTLLKTHLFKLSYDV